MQRFVVTVVIRLQNLIKLILLNFSTIAYNLKICSIHVCIFVWGMYAVLTMLVGAHWDRRGLQVPQSEVICICIILSEGSG